MSFLWYPSPKEKPIASLLGMGGGIGSNLITSSGGRYGPTPVQLGTIPDSRARYILSIPPNSTGVIYAIGSSTGVNPETYLYKSTDWGATWGSASSQIQGDGSSYGFHLLATSDTTVIVQNRGDFFRTTNSGSSFTAILETSGGQNNFFNISWDGGSYGMCGGYSRHAYTTDGWATASENSNQMGISMASAAIGTNKFLKSGLGSSGSPSKAYHSNADQSTNSEVIAATGSADTFAAGNLSNGLNCVVHRGGSSKLWYATYPGTTYTDVSITYKTNNSPTVTDNGTIVWPTLSNGIYKYIPGGSEEAVSGSHNNNPLTSIGNEVYYAIAGTGVVYAFDA